MHNEASSPNIIIYRDRLLPISETFIPNQAESFRHFKPFYVGLRSVKGLSLPTTRTLTMTDKGLVGAVRYLIHRWNRELPTKFVEHIKNLEPKLIHAHFGPDGVNALALARKLRIPLVITFHGYDATVKQEFAKGFYHKQYFTHRETLKQEASLFIAVSSFIRDKLIEQGFPLEKIIVHHIGTNVDVFQSVDTSIERNPIVLFVGRLTEKKGCEYLIRAMALVQTSLPGVELVVIGDGPLRYQLETLAAKLLKRYRFLGTQPSTHVREWMSRSFLLAAPSVTSHTGDSEGVPIVILEAQSIGLPVVSSIHSGIPDVIIHGETGLLTEERNWNQLANHIILLMQDKLMWKSFSERGKERVRMLFCIKKQSSQLEKIYQQILDSTTITNGF